MYYFCSTCEQRNDRSIVIDPIVKWWVTEDKEYWHESEGVFVRNPEGKFLFFERLIYPFALTVPSGHLDVGEDALTATYRETKEEVGIEAKELTKIATEDIVGDSCRRGADAHRWHAYLLVLDKNMDIEVKEKDEGRKPMWLTLDEALRKDLIYPVRYIVDNFRSSLAESIETPKDPILPPAA
jgi:8-oxo-dGTP pyrophosphatase MutT (NUDIX family)